MGKESPGYPGEKRGNTKGVNLEAAGVHAGEVGGYLILPDGRNAPAEIGIDQVAQEIEG